MSTDKLSELSKPVAEIKCYEDLSLSVVNVRDGFSLGRHPVYSQEYVSALIQRVERLDSMLTESVQAMKAVEQQVAELETKLATPVRLPKPCAFNLCELVDRDAVIASLREQGFTVEGDE